MRQQRGGIIIGLILGLILGLGLALGVAVYVTKVPIPFLNKMQQGRSADQDAAETRKNKDWDPNAPLHGKNPARPTPAASGAAAEASVPPSAAAPEPAVAEALPRPASVAQKPAPAASSARALARTEVKPAAPPESRPPAAPDPKPVAAPDLPKNSADPLGDLVRSRSAAAAAASTEPFSYFVQVGAFRSAEEAESQRVRLSLSGVEARVSEREQAGRAVFRVRVGPFDKKDEAERAKDKLEQLGNETALVRVQR